MVKKAEEGVVKLFGHMERMGEERLRKRVFASEVEGTKSST